MLNTSKTLKTVVFTLLTAALLIAVIGANTSIVKAQTTDTVEVLTTLGGSTNPAPGVYNYTDGTAVTFTATADNGFLFYQWVISTAASSYTDNVDNPLTLTLNATAAGGLNADGYTYSVQATFSPEAFIGPAGTTINTATDAIVVVLAGVGGTVSPDPGTYALASASSFELTANPDSGWTFSHWVIGGTPLTHGTYSFTDTPTNNPYDVDHGYGNTYSYQPVFSPISSSTSPTPTINEFSTASAIILALVLVIVAFGTYAYTRRTKK